MVFDVLIAVIIIGIFGVLMSMLDSGSKLTNAKIELELDTLNFVGDIVYEMHLTFLDPRVKANIGPDKKMTIYLDFGNITLLNSEGKSPEIIVKTEDGVQRVIIEDYENSIRFETLYSTILALILSRNE